jgi:hypothetical protein
MTDRFSSAASAADSSAAVSPSSSAFPPSTRLGNTSNDPHSFDSIPLRSQTASATHSGFAISDDILSAIAEESTHPNLGVSPANVAGSS